MPSHSKSLFLLPATCFILPLPHTASTQPHSFRAARGVGGTEERTVSFSEVRRNLSRQAGKRGGESWPQSQLSREHGGEVLQEFGGVFSIRPFFLPVCSSTCHRRNEKRFDPPSLPLPAPPGSYGALPPSKKESTSPSFFLSFPTSLCYT